MPQCCHRPRHGPRPLPVQPGPVRPDPAAERGKTPCRKPAVRLHRVPVQYAAAATGVGAPVEIRASSVKTAKLIGLGLSLALVLSGCGGRVNFGRTDDTGVSEAVLRQRENTPVAEMERQRAERGSFFDLFQNRDDPNTTVEVNRYIWNAALDVLSFLPIEAVDPFSGVIVTGYGTPPGGGRPYRATVYVQDPALDARSLHVALMTRSGPASPETVRAVEDAILTRARQLRVADSKL